MTARNAFENLATEARQAAAKAVLDDILAALLAQSGYQDGIEGGLAPLATQTTLAAVLAKLQGFNSAGVALPSTFDSLARNFTRNVNGSVATEYRTDGTTTWTQTFTRDGSDNVTAISKWVAA